MKLYLIIKEKQNVIISENIELDILYEDSDFLAVNKPADMPTHTSMGHHFGTLSNGVLYYLLKDGEDHTFHAVTRLDKNTTGVVLVAKNRYPSSTNLESSTAPFISNCSCPASQISCP